MFVRAVAARERVVPGAAFGVACTADTDGDVVVPGAAERQRGFAAADDDVVRPAAREDVALAGSVAALVEAKAKVEAVAGAGGANLAFDRVVRREGVERGVDARLTQ